jgi:hypothetical protein
MVASFLQPSLLEDAVQGTWGKIVARFSGNRDASRLGVVFELAVAAPRRDETPTVDLQHPQNLADFHSASISGLTSPPVRHNAISLELGDAFAQFCISGLTTTLAIGRGPSFRGVARQVVVAGPRYLAGRCW